MSQFSCFFMPSSKSRTRSVKILDNYWKEGEIAVSLHQNQRYMEGLFLTSGFLVHQMLLRCFKHHPS